MSQKKKDCRLCLKKDVECISIFRKVPFPSYQRISDVIMQLAPIKIYPFDGSSSYICHECFGSLHKAYEFRNMCLESDQRKRGKVVKIPSLPGLHIIKMSKSDVPLVKKKLEKQTKTKPPPEPSSETDEEFMEVEYIDEEFMEDSPTVTSQPDVKTYSKKVANASEYVASSQTVSNIATTPAANSGAVKKSVLTFIRKEEPVKPSLVRNVVLNPPPVKCIDKGVGTPIKGLRRNSDYYHFNGYLYSTNRIFNGKRYLKCESSGCSSTARVPVDSNSLFIVRTPHNHPRKDDTIAMYKAAEEMRQLAQTTTRKFRDIYDEVCERHQAIAKMLDFTVLSHSMNQSRSKTFPPGPKDVAEFSAVLASETWGRYSKTRDDQDFYQCTLELETGEYAVIFCNVEFVKKISSVVEMHVDASFLMKTREDIPFQLVTVHVLYQNHYHPILYALITKKTTAILTEIFTRLRDVWAPHIQPEVIVTDFEKNLQYSLRDVYAEIAICGSLFYFNMAIYKHLCYMKREKLIETNENFNRIYKMLILLPILPPKFTDKWIKMVEAEAEGLNVYDTAKETIEYVKTVWVDQVTPRVFNCYRCTNRTVVNTNPSFFKLRDSGYSNLSLWTFTENLLEVEALARSDLEKILEGSQPVRARRAKITNMRPIHCLWDRLLLTTTVDIEDLLIETSNLFKALETNLWLWGCYNMEVDKLEEMVDANDPHLLSYIVIYDEGLRDPTEIFDENCKASVFIATEVNDGECVNLLDDNISNQFLAEVVNNL